MIEPYDPRLVIANSTGQPGTSNCAFCGREVAAAAGLGFYALDGGELWSVCGPCAAARDKLLARACIWAVLFTTPPAATTTVNVAGSVVTEHDLADAIRRRL